MGEAARELDTNEAEELATLRRFDQESAVVEAAEGSGWWVRCRAGRRRAQRAASCLVEPDLGDVVLLAVSTDAEEAFVLAVLTRADPARVTNMAVEGDLRLKASGRVEVAAEEGIRMLTPGAFETAAQRFRMQADEASLFVKSLAYLGREATLKVQVAKVAGGMIDGVWETVTQKARRVYRNVTESEHVRAGSVDVRCDNAIALHGANAVVTAEKLIKMDSAQILMG